MFLTRRSLEGVVAKRRDSRYEPGKQSHAWIKVRFALRQEFVIGLRIPDAALLLMSALPQHPEG